MNNKGIRKLSIMSVIIFVAIVLTACFAMKFAVKTVARMITGSVDYASSIVKVTPDEVNEIAAQLFARPMSLAVVGPFDESAFG